MISASFHGEVGSCWTALASRLKCHRRWPRAEPHTGRRTESCHLEKPIRLSLRHANLQLRVSSQCGTAPWWFTPATGLQVIAPFGWVRPGLSNLVQNRGEPSTNWGEAPSRMMMNDEGWYPLVSTWQWKIMEGLLGKSLIDKVFSTAGFGYQRIKDIFLCFQNILVLPFRRKEKSAVNSTLDWFRTSVPLWIYVTSTRI